LKRAERHGGVGVLRHRDRADPSVAEHGVVWLRLVGHVITNYKVSLFREIQIFRSCAGRLQAPL
jgi:hypothetical protein